MKQQDSGCERRVRRVIVEGLDHCPPMTHDEVLDIAVEAGATYGVPADRVEDIFEQELASR